MSEIKVNKISPRTACGTVTLGDSGDTITIPSGVTMTNNGTAAGFGSTGEVSWDTTVKTSGFTAVSGVGYFVNTTSGAITVTLPASPSAGDVVAVSDYAGTADTDNITIGRNGSNINGAAADLTISKENSAITLVYVDGTQGWKATDTSSLTDIELQPAYVTATGGTITCSPCGDYKIHTFTGPGTFTVSCAGNSAGSSTVDYLVVAGGGGGAGGFSTHGSSAAGGAGGYRESSGAASGCYSVSPLGACVSALPVSVQPYTVTVGAGGAGSSGNASSSSGNNSVFSTIISTAGGGGGTYGNPGTNKSGGSGGGGAFNTPDPVGGGAGNTPPVSPPQGNKGGGASSSGGAGPAGSSGGGGGGATAVGANAVGAGAGGAGGAGATSSINGTPTTRAGGGGGGGSFSPASGGAGGGGSAPGGCNPGTAGTTNTGGGGGGGSHGSLGTPDTSGGAGGSGIVIIRYKFQN
jgi:hypothetical protein